MAKLCAVCGKRRENKGGLCVACKKKSEEKKANGK